MCNAYSLRTDLSRIGAASRDQLGLDLVFPPGVAAETSNTPVPQDLYPKKDGLFLRPREDGGGALEPAVGRWGLVPWNHKGSLKAIKFPCNNARSETMAVKWPFKEATARRRCVIPMTAFTEWTGPAGRKTRHSITAADGGMLFAAGLWEDAIPQEGPMVSYTMVMCATAEGDDMRPFHDRQPVLLDRARAETWLDLGADYAGILRALPPGSLAVDPREPAGG
ncbi:MAG: SOS response-associated peptidase [Pseudomonadota bacterium]